jgi:hypothetical protein
MPIHQAEADDYNTVGGTYANGDMHYGEPGFGTFQGVWKSKPIGGDQPHNNIQPSIITHVWERIG